MNIKRKVLAESTNLEELVEKIKQEAEARKMGEARDRNDHGPVYINATHDLRIERDPGQWGAYRLMLLEKVQPKSSIFSKLRGRG